MEMHPKIAPLFQGREAQYPKNVESKYPRVFARVMEVWNTPAAGAVFDDLLVDKRGGRQGFPAEVISELMMLGRICDRLREIREAELGISQPKNPWGQEGVKRGLEREQITYDQKGLFRSVELGNERAIKLFFDAGVDTEVRNPAGWTPLLSAVYASSERGAAALIKYKVNINAQDGQGYTALHWAAFKGALGIVKLLIDGKANVNMQSDLGLTPLHQAAMNGHVRVVEALVQGGADLNKANNDGWTPLHQAIADANVEVIRQLVAAGADRNIPDLRKVSPLDLAKRRNKAPVLSVLGVTS